MQLGYSVSFCCPPLTIAEMVAVARSETGTEIAGADMSERNARRDAEVDAVVAAVVEWNEGLALLEFESLSGLCGCGVDANERLETASVPARSRVEREATRSEAVRRDCMAA